MKRLKEHFEKAICVKPHQRRIGMEIETLFINSDSKPINPSDSQNLMRKLAVWHGWKILEIKNRQIIKLQKTGFVLIYELGWNNLELITPAFLLSDAFLKQTQSVLNEIFQTASEMHIQAIQKSWDGFQNNTLMVPDKRDEIWLELDGPALFGLGHIASIQFNIDLASIEEGMDWIKSLNQLYCFQCWPFGSNRQIWRNYIRGSNANYEKNRYAPPPHDFHEYLKQLAGLKVVMEQKNGTARIAANPRPFHSCAQVNIELFLRSVWWYFRLRVRNNKLVLEIRDIPRWLGIADSWKIIRQSLNL